MAGGKGPGTEPGGGSGGKAPCGAMGGGGGGGGGAMPREFQETNLIGEI